MSINKKPLFVVGVAVLALGSLAFAEETPAVAQEQSAAVEEEVAAAVEEEEAALEEAAVAEEPPAEVAVEETPAPAPAPEVAKEESKKTGLTVTPYGAAHYRFRGQFNTRTDEDDESQSIANYTNHLAWRLGVKATVNEQLSLQFQIGNDWGSPENVNYLLNNGIRSRGPAYQNLYVHLAYARWNPGYLFIEAGVVPLNSNGTLDLLESSLSRGRYAETVFDGWSQYNSSMIGFKIGAPLVKGDIKVSAELFQTVIDNRAQSLPTNLADDPIANPASLLLVLDVPVEAGALKITPEFTSVINRNFNRTTEEGDHEFIGGLSASYKISGDVSVSLNGGYGGFSNENSKVGAYDSVGTAQRLGSISADDAADIIPYKTSGLFIGAGTSIKAGPGNIQLDVKYNSTENGYDSDTKDETHYDYINADLRYSLKVNKNFSILPRYRLDTVLYPKNNANDTELRHRFELVFEGSF
jgi:hypothetical protein